MTLNEEKICTSRTWWRARFYEAIASTYHQTCELVGFVMYLKQGWIMQIGYL